MSFMWQFTLRFLIIVKRIGDKQLITDLTVEISGSDVTCAVIMLTSDSCVRQRQISSELWTVGGDSKTSLLKPCFSFYFYFIFIISLLRTFI